MDYRLYFLDDRGHIKRPLDVQCETDEEALTLARGHRHPHGMEVWQGKRLVDRIPPSSENPPEALD